MCKYSGGALYWSNDFGKTWYNSGVTGNSNWYGIAISGTNAIACDINSSIWWSSDAGHTWTASGAGNKTWYSCSISGNKAVACENNGSLWWSEDAGHTWSVANATGSNNWTGVSVYTDNNGVYNAVACENNGSIWWSDDGKIWTDSGVGNKRWNCIAISGTNATAGVVNGNEVWSSSDAGHTWTIKAPVDKYWNSVSLSGMIGVATSANSYLWLSTDGGQTWNKDTSLGVKVWTGASVDSNNMVACVYNGSIWYTFQPVCLSSKVSVLMADKTYKSITNVKRGDKISSINDIELNVVHAGYSIVNYNMLQSTNLLFIIPKNMFGNGIPFKDVYISGHHRVIISTYDKYIGIQAFKFGDLRVLKHDEILDLTELEEVRYYHIEVEGGKNIMICDGLPLETLDINEWTCNHIEN
jgi:photosystem II stability/assembly factor-like uncharacterized protein